MTTSSSPAELAGKFAKLATDLRGSTRAGVTAGALLVTTSVRSELARAAPSGRLSGVGTRGARISVGFDAPKAAANPVALVRMRGPAHLLERKTKPHPIRPRRRRGTRALAGAGFGPVANVAMHPGSPGKHPFEKGVTAVQHRVADVVHLETQKAVRKAFT